MADGRKRLGGWKYKKKSEEKQRKQKEILERTKKIDSFFTNSVPQPPIEEFEDNVPSTSKETSVLLALCEDEDATENHENKRRRRINQYYHYYHLNLLNLTKTLQSGLLMMNS